MRWYKRDPDAALVGMVALTDEQYRLYSVYIDILYSKEKDPGERVVVSFLPWNIQRFRRVRAELEALGKLERIKKVGEKFTQSRVKVEIKLAKSRIKQTLFARQKALEIKARAFQSTDGELQLELQSEKKKKDTLRSRQERERGKANGRSKLEPEGFAEFWAIYPRKVAPDSARRAFARALRRTTLEIILTALKRQQWPADRQWIKHPATWLNGGCWNDEPSPRRLQSMEGGLT
jgi:hypothetical protein